MAGAGDGCYAAIRAGTKIKPTGCAGRLDRGNEIQKVMIQGLAVPSVVLIDLQVGVLGDTCIEQFVVQHQKMSVQSHGMGGHLEVRCGWRRGQAPGSGYLSNRNVYIRSSKNPTRML